MKNNRKPHTNTRLYANIKRYRERLGLSQEELARRVGYTSQTSIAKIEKGIVDLPQTRIAQFAKVFGITPDELLGWGEKTPAENEELSASVREFHAFADELTEQEAGVLLATLKAMRGHG